MGETRFQGRLWVLAAPDGGLIADIDTDQIYHNAYLHVTDLREMGRFALGNLEGWGDFPERVRKGDILLAGRNFGAGSSRQQAVDCFKALGVALILAPSYGAIYFRNAVNSAFPVLSGPGLEAAVSAGLLQTGDEIEADIRTGSLANLTRKADLALNPMSEVQFAVWRAGGLFGFANFSDGS
jgi:3-isopropylmalate/(R)-2-methylmalate dehydratase small subunit